MASVSDGTDAWIVVWYFIRMKIHRPLELSIFSSMFFSSVTHNNSSRRIESRQPVEVCVWLIGYHQSNLWIATKVWHLIDLCTERSAFACLPHRGVMSGLSPRAAADSEWISQKLCHFYFFLVIFFNFNDKHDVLKERCQGEFVRIFSQICTQWENHLVCWTGNIFPRC